MSIELSWDQRHSSSDTQISSRRQARGGRQEAGAPSTCVPTGTLSGTHCDAHCSSCSEFGARVLACVCRSELLGVTTGHSPASFMRQGLSQNAELMDSGWLPSQLWDLPLSAFSLRKSWLASYKGSQGPN